MLVFMDEKDVTNMITIVMTIAPSWCRTFGIKRGPHTGEEEAEEEKLDQYKRKTHIRLSLLHLSI